MAAPEHFENDAYFLIEKPIRDSIQFCHFFFALLSFSFLESSYRLCNKKRHRLRVTRIHSNKTLMLHNSMLHFQKRFSGFEEMIAIDKNSA